MGPFQNVIKLYIVTFASLLVIFVFLSRIINIGQGRPVFIYNLLDLKRTTWSGPALGDGKHTIVFDFKSDGPELGKGGTGIFSVDGKEVSRNYMEHGTPVTFPEDESFDVGSDTRSGVSLLKYRYEVPFAFTGTINKLSFHLEPKEVAEATKPVTEEDGKRLKSISDSVTNEEN